MADIPRMLEDKIRRLRHQSEPTDTDVFLTMLMRYVSIVASYYANHGRREWGAIAGSTREKTKLKWTKDSGDVDIIFCSKKLEIPVKNLVHRKETPCFVWIQGNDTARDLGIKLIDDEYIPSDLLRTVTPELFTFSRGLYVMFTSGMDTVSGSDSRFTTTGVRSKVGLAVTEYQGLHITEGAVCQHQEQTNEHKIAVDDTGNDLDRTRTLPEGDTVDISEAYKQHEAYDDELPPYQNDLDAKDDTETFESKHKHYHATYTHKSSKDFVPVMKVSGQLKCMDEWRKRPRKRWPKPEDIDNIYKCDVYVVSKFAPISPDEQRDFCLSFNDAEYKLSCAMDEVQRDVMLILKAYLKGVYTKAHEQKQLELKLTSFQLKTALYWVSEEQEEPWTDRDIVEAIVQVLSYLLMSLETKRLNHYFIESNLFAGFPEEEFVLLIDSTKSILEDPVEAIDVFFALDDGQPAEIVLTEEEMKLLTEVSSDGGERNRREMIRIAYDDFNRTDDDRDKRISERDVLPDALFAVVQEIVKDIENLSKPEQGTALPDSGPEGIVKLIPQIIPGVIDHLKCVLSAGGLNKGTAINRQRAMTILECSARLYSIVMSRKNIAYAGTVDRKQDPKEVGESLIETVADFLTAFSRLNPDEEEKRYIKQKFLQCFLEFLKVHKLISE